jgi:stage II sporulation protein D
VIRGVLAVLLLVLLSGPIAFAQTVQIGVLQLFHPRQINLSAAHGEALAVVAAEKTCVLETNSRTAVAEVQVSGSALLLNCGGQVIQASEIRATSRTKNDAEFVLAIPGKTSRHYRGTLVVKAADGVVVPVVSMDLETAVASAVQAESAPGAPLEALKAQAVATRSYFVAGKGRHRNYDFCDLTHCQFLREPPGAESLAAVATRATRGLVLTYIGKPFAAMFTRSCGGHTRTPAELGMTGSDYPYFSVACDVCYRDPSRWSRQISQQDAALLAGKGEAGRLAVNRRLGWNTISSNSYATHRENAEVALEGAGEGHGIGLCQRGAKGMADNGVGFREILNHYFPNTTLSSVGVPPGS